MNEPNDITSTMDELKWTEPLYNMTGNVSFPIHHVIDTQIKVNQSCEAKSLTQKVTISMQSLEYLLSLHNSKNIFAH